MTLEKKHVKFEWLSLKFSTAIKKLTTIQEVTARAVMEFRSIWEFSKLDSITVLVTLNQTFSTLFEI